MTGLPVIIFLSNTLVEKRRTYFFAVQCLIFQEKTLNNQSKIGIYPTK